MAGRWTLFGKCCSGTDEGNLDCRGRSVGHGMVLQFPRVIVERWPYLATDWPAEAHLVMQIFSGNTINQIFQFVGFIHDLDRDTEL